MARSRTDTEFLDDLTRLFLAEGIEDLTIAEIAARLGCSRRRLYEIASSKDGIFCAIVQRYCQRTLDEGEARVRQERNPAAALAVFLNVGIKASTFASTRYLEDVERSEGARKCFDQYQRARSARLIALIDEGVRQGVFAPCHGLVVAEAILGAAMRVRRPEFLSEAGLTIDQAFREIERVLLGGLLKREAGLEVPDALAG